MRIPKPVTNQQVADAFARRARLGEVWNLERRPPSRRELNNVRAGAFRLHRWAAARAVRLLP